MDVIATLIEITAFNTVTGAQQTMRVTNRNDPRATTANGVSWLPLLQTAPSVGVSVFDGAFASIGQLSLGTFTVTLADGLGDPLTQLAWDGADIKIYAGDMQLGVYPLIYRAVGDGANRKGRLELEIGLTTRSSLLEVGVLTQSYAGTGGLEGDAGLKGAVKPWAFGAARFCNAVLLDPVRQIYQVSAYGPVEATTDVFEGGQPITFAGDFAGTVTDFMTGVGPALGTWTRYNQYGLFRLGSQPLYEVTCHVKGDSNTVVGGAALTKIGDIIGRILSATTTMPVKASSIAQLNVAEPEPFDDYFDQQQSVSSAIATLLLSVGGYYSFDENGSLIFGRVRFGASIMTLDGLNTQEPAVLGINQLPTSAPIWSLRLGAEQCHFVHAASDVPAILRDQAEAIEEAQATADDKNKTFPASTTPPVGAIDGDLWPDTSVSPTTTRRYNSATATWIAVANQVTTANQITYTAGGQTVDSLKPAEGGANVTATNISSGFFGQGTLASQSYILPNQATSIGTSINAIADPTFTDPAYWNGLRTSTGGGVALGVITSHRVTGDGTNPGTAFGVVCRTPDIACVGGERIECGATVRCINGGNTAYAAISFKDRSGAVTEFAIGIASQVTGATSVLLNRYTVPANVVSYNLQLIVSYAAGEARTGDYAFGKPFIQPLSALGDNVVGSNGLLLGDTDAITSLGSAASFFGQGAFATVNSAAYGSAFLTGFGALSPLANLFFGSPLLLESSGGVSATTANFKTSLGQAASLFGQGAFATLSSAAYGSGLLTGFGALAPLGSVNFGSAFLLEAAGGAQATLAAFKTISGISSGFTGQGSLASLSSLANGGAYLTGFGGLSSLGSVNFGSPQLLEAAGGAQATLAAFKTSSGIASGFSGQGALASMSTLAYGSTALTGFGSIAALSSLANGGAYLTGFGGLSSLASINFGSAQLLETSGGAQATLAAFKTISGVASSVTGQGTLATQNGITPSQTTALGTATNAISDPTFLDAAYWTGLVPVVNNTINNSLGTARAHRIIGDGTNPGTALGFVCRTPDIACIGGERIECGAMVRCNSAGNTAYVAISFKDRAGVATEFPVGIATPTLAAVSTLVNRYTVPVGAVSYNLQLIVSYAAGEARTGEYAFGKPFIQPLSALGDNVVTSTGGLLTDALAVTSQGISSGFSGQGSLASLSSLANGGAYLTGFGAASSQSFFSLGSTYLRQSDGTTGLTNASVVTSLGVASAFSGQTAWATYATKTPGQVEGQVQRLGTDGSLSASYVYKDGVAFLADRFPAEAGSNVTETRTSAAILNQGFGATAAQNLVDNRAVPIGANAVVNSGFQRGLYAFNVLNSGGVEGGLNLDNYSGQRQVVWSHYLGTLAPGQIVDCAATASPWTGSGLAGGVDQMRKYCMPVSVGDRVFASVLAAQHRCNFNLYLLRFNASGGFVDGPEAVGGRLNGGGAGNPANFDRLSVISEVTSTDIAYVGLMMRMVGTGQADSYLFWTEPMMGKLGAGQTVLPPYVDGPADPLSDQTSTNTASGIVGQGSFATQSNLNLDNTSYFSQPDRFRTIANGDSRYFSASAILYEESGQLVSSMRPAEAGSNVTETRVASAITNQGTYATTSSVAYGSNMLTGFGTIASMSSLFFGSTTLRETNNGATATLANFKTSSGIAASVSGQGALATKSAIVPSQAVALGTSTNAITDPTFSDSAYWNGLVPVVNNTLNIALGTARTHRIIGDGTNPGTALGFVCRTPDIACIGGERIECGAGVRCTTAGNTAYVAITFVDRLGVGTSFSVGIATSAAGAVSNLLNRYTVPATAVSYNLQLIVSYAAGEVRTGDYAFGRPFIQPLSALSDNVVTSTGGLLTDAQAVTAQGVAASVAGQGTFATQSMISRTNYASYFNSNAVSMNYTITRADGTSIVTESLAITSQGVSSGFAGQGTLATVNQAAAGNLAYGATGRVSLYGHQVAFNVNDVGTPAVGAFVSLMGIGLTPQEGNPAVGIFAFNCETISGTDNPVYVRVIRVSDGRAVWGGEAGEKFKTGSIANIFLDSTGVGTRQQYDVQMKTPSGGIVQCRQRSMFPTELGRATIEEIQIKALDPNNAPGGGTSGGGNVNGSAVTTPATDPNSTTNPGATRPGLNRFVQQQQQ